MQITYGSPAGDPDSDSEQGIGNRAPREKGDAGISLAWRIGRVARVSAQLLTTDAALIAKIYETTFCCAKASNINRQTHFDRP